MIQVRQHIDCRLHCVCDRPGRRTFAGTVGARKATTHRVQSSGRPLSTTARASSVGQPGQTFVQVVQHGTRRGRKKDRIRYPYRHRPKVQQLREGGGLHVGILNTQGWNWASTEIRHEEKAHELLCIMRRQHVDAVLLVDLHHPPVVLNWHSRNVNVAMEELFVDCG